MGDIKNVWFGRIRDLKGSNQNESGLKKPERLEKSQN